MESESLRQSIRVRNGSRRRHSRRTAVNAGSASASVWSMLIVSRLNSSSPSPTCHCCTSPDGTSLPER